MSRILESGLIHKSCTKPGLILISYIYINNHISIVQIRLSLGLKVVRFQEYRPMTIIIFVKITI